MLLNKEEDIIFRYKGVSEQVEPKKKIKMIRSMLSSRDVCQKKVAYTEGCVHKED